MGPLSERSYKEKAASRSLMGRVWELLTSKVQVDS